MDHERSSDTPVETVRARAVPARRFVFRPRLLLLVFAVALLSAVLVILRYWTKPPVSNPASPAPTGFQVGEILADDSQLKQLVIEPAGSKLTGSERNFTGKLAFNEERLTPVFPPFAGRVLEVRAGKGEFTVRNQALLVMEAPDLIAAQNDLSAGNSDIRKARVALDIAEKAAYRARKLYEGEAVAAKDLQLAENDLQRAREDLRRAEAAQKLTESRIAMFGKDQAAIDAMSSNPLRIDRTVPILAPISGTVVDRKVGTGQFVKPDSPDPMFLIADLSTLWVIADVYESDLANIRTGSMVDVQVDSFPGRHFSARVSLISPTVDPATRTIHVKCELPNPNGILKPDMFARISIPGGVSLNLPNIPAAAVVAQGNDSFIFVESTYAHFQRRAIQVTSPIDGRVNVIKGLAPGERIVTRGAILLNEAMKSQS